MMRRQSLKVQSKVSLYAAFYLSKESISIVKFFYFFILAMVAVVKMTNVKLFAMGAN
jgi:hypothetical protein